MGEGCHHHARCHAMLYLAAVLGGSYPDSTWQMAGCISFLSVFLRDTVIIK